MDLSCTEIRDLSHLNEIKQGCEKLINQTQADLTLFQHEQIQLREQILDIIEENKRLNTKLESEKGAQSSTNTATADGTAATGESRDDATRERLTNDALKNVKKQIDYLQAENQELRSLSKSSQRTIQNLEHEIENYRKQLFQPNSITELKQKYTTAIKLLESTIKTQKTEILKQSQIIENVLEQKRQFRKHIENLETALIEKERELSQRYNNVAIEKMQSKMLEYMQQNKNLEKSLKLSRRVIEERFEREKCALKKVQEALAIAETAVTDKEDAERREQVVKEECDNLAATIGEVMDEAAHKVEKDMESLRKRFSERERTLLDAHEKIKEDLQNQRKFNQILETRCNRFEQKYRDAAKDNDTLRQELQAARCSLEELELKLNTHEEMLKELKNTKKRAEEHEQEVQQYLQTNKQLKEKYKAAVEDVSKRFEKEVYRLQNENANLKAENQVIKFQKCVSSDGE